MTAFTRRRRTLGGVRVCGLALLGVGLLAPPASAFNKYLVIPRETEVADAPAYVYANLRNAEAFNELDRRQIPYRRVAAVDGVRAPIRLTGPLSGVHIHSVLPEAERGETPFEILDARLALALDDLCAILAQHDVVEVVHFTMYRPAGKKTDPRAAQTRHPAGLAIDLGAMKKRNGDWLAVGPHWPSDLGERTCGLGAKQLRHRRGRELMSILCEAADARMFHYMLTPHYDQAHGDHFHLEIKPEVKWFLVN